MSLNDETKKRLIFLANKYENASFANEDPSQFLKWYSSVVDTESACFIAALLSFGNRKQFIPKIRAIFEVADKAGGMANWLKSGLYKGTFLEFANCCGCNNNFEKKFYRFYSFNDMICLFDALSLILNKECSLGEFFKKEWQKGNCELGSVISGCFLNCSIVPHGKNSANKRIYMFLRWMVRRDSPVDLGLWQWYSPSDLIIPLDTHVIQESVKLNLIPEKSSGTLKTAIEITRQLKEIWPDDPCKGDFALFGLGVDN